MNNIAVVYTPWDNLKKTADMDVGQIGFHSDKEVKSYLSLITSCGRNCTCNDIPAVLRVARKLEQHSTFLNTTSCNM